MTLRQLHSKTGLLLELGQNPDSVVLVKPRELGDLFLRNEVTNVAPGLSSLSPADVSEYPVVLLEYRGQPPSPEVQRPH